MIINSLAKSEFFLFYDTNPVFATLFYLIGRRFPSRGGRSSE